MRDAPLRSRPTRCVILLSLWAALASACGPSSTVTSPLPATTASAKTSTSVLTVTGSTTAAPGAYVSYQAVLLTGTQMTNVTGQAVWGPVAGSGLFLSFASPGQALATAPGATNVTASYNGLTATPLHVIVAVPRGQADITGTVTETSGRPLPGVSVDIPSPTGADILTTTDGSGHYVLLLGAADSVQVQVSADGFTTQTRQIALTAGFASQDFVLSPVATPADVSGDWTMMLSAAPSCRNNLPPIARDRQYQIHFTQQGTGLQLTVTGATLNVINQGENKGTVLDHVITFPFEGDTAFVNWVSTDLVDQLSPTETFGFEGNVSGTVTSYSQIDATMDGWLEYWDSTMPTFDGGPNAICRSAVITLGRVPGPTVSRVRR